MATVERIYHKNGKVYGPYTYEYDPEKERARRKQYYADHREKAIADVRAWQLANPERARELMRAGNKRHYYKHKPYIKFRENHTAVYLLRLAKKRCTASGMALDITVEDIVVPAVCPLLGIPVDIKSPNKDEHPSLDRLDNTKGYIKGNVFVVNYRGNRIKSDATAEELRRVAINIDRLMGKTK